MRLVAKNPLGDRILTDGEKHYIISSGSSDPYPINWGRVYATQTRQADCKVGERVPDSDLLMTQELLDALVERRFKPVKTETVAQNACGDRLVECAGEHFIQYKGRPAPETTPVNAEALFRLQEEECSLKPGDKLPSTGVVLTAAMIKDLQMVRYVPFKESNRHSRRAAFAKARRLSRS
jgi:hypothetical protein